MGEVAGAVLDGADVAEGTGLEGEHGVQGCRGGGRTVVV